MYLKRQSFLVFGLSKSGKAAAKYLLAQGALVYVYDEIENDRILQTVTELETMGLKKYPRINWKTHTFYAMRLC
jgi:UDP-N-acetylmuramoylalanine-D-glutamate ligase